MLYVNHKPAFSIPIGLIGYAFAGFEYDIFIHYFSLNIHFLFILRLAGVLFSLSDLAARKTR